MINVTELVGKVRSKKKETGLSVIRTDDADFSVLKDAVSLGEKPVYFITKGSIDCISATQVLVEKFAPCQIVLATWKMNEDSARQLLKWKEEGKVSSVEGLIDFRTRSMDPKVFQLMESVFDRLVPTHCHAKVVVVSSANGGAVLLTSSNFTRNNRFEFGHINFNPEVVSFYLNALNDELDSGAA